MEGSQNLHEKEPVIYTYALSLYQGRQKHIERCGSSKLAPEIDPLNNNMTST